MTQELTLIEANPVDLRSEAMLKAAELRAEGLDASRALELGWQEAKAENPLYQSLSLEADELSGKGIDAHSGLWYEDEDEDMELVEARPRRRNPTRTEFEPNWLLLGLVGFAGWAIWQRQRTGKWFWEGLLGRQVLRLPPHRVDVSRISHQSVIPVKPATPDGFYEKISLIVP